MSEDGAITNHAPERSRPYFEHEIQCGRRVICDWHCSKRWPDLLPSDPLLIHDHQIEGFEFQSEQAAAAFDLEQVVPGSWDNFCTWEEAERWVRA